MKARINTKTAERMFMNNRELLAETGSNIPDDAMFQGFPVEHDSDTEENHVLLVSTAGTVLAKLFVEFIVPEGHTTNAFWWRLPYEVGHDWFQKIEAAVAAEQEEAEAEIAAWLPARGDDTTTETR